MMRQTTEPTKSDNPIVFFSYEESDIEEPSKIKWTREEYYRLSDLGFFNGKRVELIEGEIFVKYTYSEFDEGEYEMSAMSSLHYAGVNVAAEVLREVFKKKFFVAVQCPINVGEDSEPEPDIAVIEGKVRDFKNAIPKTAALVVEISDSSLFFDQTRKASLYARANIQDYWIVDVRNHRLEIYRRPIKDKTMFYGFGYAERLIFNEKDTVSPLAKPDAKIKVADLLP
ncbi:MAG: Uma2 family endonuclease [Acidobacteria bacterium]|nr:Uma2 family endonuclease [Acidobacteriota bacterium]